MIGRLVHTADFERVLSTSPRSRSTHFAMHHVMGTPTRPPAALTASQPQELSTDPAPELSSAVDKSLVRHWLGCVIPKRHARRSVTRNLLKRQIRNAMVNHESALVPGLWLVRLRTPFAATAFVSAASAALRDAAQDELQQLFARAAR